MARLINVPGVASLLLVSRAEEIDDLIAHPSLDRAFVRGGRLFNRVLVSGLDRQMRHEGEVLAAFRPRDDAHRQARQAELFARLDAYATASAWPPAPLGEMARYVVEGRESKAAEAALAFAIASPFLRLEPGAAQDDTYKPIGRHLWRLHRRVTSARTPLSPWAMLLRLTRADRRARAAILAHVRGDPYGLHAVEITLANARAILDGMRRVLAERPAGASVTPRDLAWAAIRTAPEVVVRQSGPEPMTLPHVASRVPPRTLVLLRMRRGLATEPASGYEFASRHWSACPARRYVMRLFTAVAETAVDLARTGGRP